MTQENLIEKINQIAFNNSLTGQEKIEKFSALMAWLKPVDNSEELKVLCTHAIASAEKINRPEMVAQFCMIRAKVSIVHAGSAIHEMKNITLAPSWFGFALQSQESRYFELDRKVKKIWSDTQADIDKAFVEIRKKPIAGAGAVCLKAAGETYGQYYLQLRLYTFRSKSSFHAKLANMYIFRWLGVDDYFVLDATARKKLKIARRDCLSMLHRAASLFKKERSYVYLADTFLALSTEHHSFVNPIRARYYAWRAERLIKKHEIKELEDNLALTKRRSNKIGRSIGNITNYNDLPHG